MSSNITVYTGIWTNWSKGAVAGATLTLPARNGAILIAVLALFIQLAGGHSWSIICFIAHQLRTTPEAKDGLHYQQQATLRNNLSDFVTVWRLARIGWAWRSSNIKSTRKSLALVSIGLLHILAFGTAGVLSSHLATLGNEVLLARSQNCGILNAFAGVIPGNPLTNDTELARYVAFNLFYKESIDASNQYVQNCLTQSQTLPECNTLKRPRLNWTSTSNTPCPFQSGICLSPVNSSLRFDTGLIDSRDDLGINSKDEGRLKFRKTVTCNPLVTEGYIKSAKTAGPLNQSYIVWGAFYGPNIGSPSAFTAQGVFPNATFVTSNDLNFVLPYELGSVSPYRVTPTLSYPHLPDRGFRAIPALFSSDRSLTLVFAESYAMYAAPSDDLWMPAHQVSDALLIAKDYNTTFKRFGSDRAVNVLACTEQFQICNPSLPTNQSQQCTSLQAMDGLALSLSRSGSGGALLQNEYQRTVASVILLASELSTLQITISNLASTLLANDLVVRWESSPLPSNQWMLEAQNWFSVSMVNTQRLIVAFATGPADANAAQYTYRQADGNPGLQQFCGNQIIQRADFTNFSVLAIALIFTLGGVIICTSLFLDTAVGYLQTRFKRGLYHQVRWQLDSTLQLQRMAFEEVGLGSWSGGANEVPVTEKGEVFAPAEEWDEWHPSIGGKALKREWSIHVL